MARRVVLIDRDGTVNVEKHYLSHPADVELLPGVAEGLRLLQASSFGLVIVTNQAAIGRGYFDLATLSDIHCRLQRLLADEGVKLDGIYFCPHHPDDNCDCRKPKPGLARNAARDLGFDLKEAFVIGDKDVDIGLAYAAGCRSVLVRTGYGKQHERTSTFKPDFVVDDFLQAAGLICGDLLE